MSGEGVLEGVAGTVAFLAGVPIMAKKEDVMVKKSRGWLRVAWCRLMVPLTFGSVTALKES